MIKKAKKLWSKKLKAAIISLSLGLAVALGGAVAAIGISANKNNLGGTLADGTVASLSGNGSVSNSYKMSDRSHWATIIAAAQAKTASECSESCKADTTVAHTQKHRIYVDLIADIVAADDATYSKSFGQSPKNDEGEDLNDGSGAYCYGALCVPSDANIVLNLRTFKIDRALTEAVNYGSVIISYGNLEISGDARLDDVNGRRVDGVLTNGTTVGKPAEVIGTLPYGRVEGVSVSGGRIMGGNVLSHTTNVLYAGGVTVRDGTFTMNSGAICENKSTGTIEYTSPGVHVGQGFDSAGNAKTPATFNFKGGYLSLNYSEGSSSDGGGISVYGGYLYATGGDISWNTLTGNSGSGGGAIAPNGETLIKGISMRHNMGGYGGALVPYGQVTHVENCTITDNIGFNQGGAIYVTAGSIYLKNCEVTENKVLNVQRVNSTINFADKNIIAIANIKGAVFGIGGKIVLHNNTRENEDKSKVENASVKLTGDQKIVITEVIDKSSNIYIELDKPRVFTDGFASESTGTSPSVFTSNLSGYVVAMCSTGEFTGELEFRNALPSDAWNLAVERSLKEGGITVNLTQDMIAGTNGSFGYGVGFGSTSDASVAQSGALRVPVGAEITLRLDTFNVDRGLTSAIDNGFVIIVYGKLTVIGNGIGMITGGV